MARVLFRFSSLLIFCSIQICNCEDEADQNEESFVPIIDFGKFLNPETEDDKQGVVDSIYEALTTVGFFYIKNHGISDDRIAGLFNVSHTYFELPLEEKEKYPIDAVQYAGYTANQIQILHGEKPDYKESHDTNMPHVLAHPHLSTSILPTFYPELIHLTHNLLRSYALALNLDEEFFVDKHQRLYAEGNLSTFRLSHYPKQPKNYAGLACGPHTDWGSTSFVFQDEAGGLEAWNRKTKSWSAVPPQPGTIVVNVGNLMQRWTNDVFVATMHRVIQTEERYSFINFVNPDSVCMVDPQDIFPDQEKKYEPMAAKDYLIWIFEQSLAGTAYPDLEYGDLNAVGGSTTGTQDEQKEEL